MLDTLDGVRVLDLTSVVLGPMATQTLGDLGAEVIKIESVEGDVARSAGALSPNGDASLFVNNNRNKKSIAIDLKHEDGKRILEQLIDTADVFIHNMRPNAITRLGFGASDVLARNATIIYVAAVGFGGKGPYSGRPAYDDVIQAASGFASLPMEVGLDPAYAPSIIADKIGALYTTQGVLAALVARARTGAGCTIEVPMFESLVSFLMNEHLGAATFDRQGAPGYGRLLNKNRKPYRTSDGWLAVMPYTGRHWSAVLDLLGRGSVTREPWFESASERNRRSAELYGILGEELISRSTEEWVTELVRLDIPYSRINTMKDLLDDPHLDAVGFFEPTDDVPYRVRSAAQPITFEGVTRHPDRAPPGLGVDADEILGGLGLTRKDIDALRAKGVLGGATPGSSA